MPETPEHLFLLCEWTHQIWANQKLKLNPSPNNISRIDKWLLEVLTLERNPRPKELVVGTLWQIWKIRNAMVFKGELPQLQEVVQEVETNLESFNRWNPKRPKRSKNYVDVVGKWLPPMKGHLKINVDASWTENQREGSIAELCRDENGVLRDGFAAKIEADSPLKAEALAVRAALWKVTKEREETSPTLEKNLKIEVQSDCKIVMDSLMGFALSPWTVEPILEDCKLPLAQLKGVSVPYAHRETNKPTDWIARVHRDNRLPRNWILYPPHPLWVLLSNDSELSCSSTTY
ncbi:hypothetical protein ACJRO7_014708 [Eucalyptus globulus]|uniref:RNase H type-1 domain-containing protein n=1 Tax=Eucalyptus globulus TaxID=34317 RepID=A0ABD3L242_EUCGL